jgi:DNA-directed RNA polymerase specialized sigma24 family protein
MRNHAAVLVTQRFRRVRREVLIDKISRDDREAADHLGTRDDLETIDGGHYEIEAGLQLTIDVRRALDGLSPKLQNIALLLSELSVVEACVKLGKSRSGVYQLIRQLRDAFLRAGFQHVGRGNR